MGDVVPSEIPLVFHLLLANLTLKLLPNCMHVQNVLFEIEFVAEHPLTVLTHPRLSRLPGGPQQSRHLVRAQQRGHLVCSAGPVHTQEIEGGGARGGEQRRG